MQHIYFNGLAMHSFFGVCYFKVNGEDPFRESNDGRYGKRDPYSLRKTSSKSGSTAALITSIVERQCNTHRAKYQSQLSFYYMGQQSEK